MDDPTTANQFEQPGAQQAEQPSGYEICIKVAGDGTLSVGVESEAQEGAEMQGGESGESYQPAGSIKEALTMALDIFRADGQMPTSGSQEDADFDSGYTNRSPQ